MCVCVCVHVCVSKGVCVCVRLHVCVHVYCVILLVWGGDCTSFQVVSCLSCVMSSNAAYLYRVGSRNSAGTAYSPWTGVRTLEGGRHTCVYVLHMHVQLCMSVTLCVCVCVHVHVCVCVCVCFEFCVCIFCLLTLLSGIPSMQTPME